MINKVKYKSVETDIENRYISKIKSIIDKVRNVTFEVSIKEFNVYELENMMFVIMNIYDDTGTISALLVSNRDEKTKNIIKNINLKDKYRINGDITLDVDFLYDGLKEIVKDNEKIKKEMLTDKILLVRGLQVIENDKGS